MAIKLLTTDTVLTNAAASILTAGANEANTIVKALNNNAIMRSMRRRRTKLRQNWMGSSNNQ